MFNKYASYGGILMKRILVFVVLTFLALSGYVNASEVDTRKNFKNFIIKNTKDNKKILLLSPGQYFTVKDQLVALRKKGYKFMRPSAL